MKHIFRTLLSVCLALAMLAACTVSVSAAQPAQSAEIDYHRYSQLLVDICGQRRIDEAIQVIDAFLAGEQSVVLDDYEIGDGYTVLYLVCLMCPLFDGTTFTGWDYVDDTTHVFHWTDLCTAEEFADLKQRFEDICLEYLNKLEDGDSDLIKALSLYYDLTKSRLYNDDLQEELNAATSEEQSYIASSLRTMLEGTGTCNQFGTCYAFLCIQAGLNAVDVGCSYSELSDGPHEWDVVQLDGKYYYCDPTWDLPAWDGGLSGVSYFGMTAEYRFLAGGFAPEDTAFSVNSSPITPESLGLDDERFADLHCWTCSSITGLTFDREAGTVTADCEDGTVLVIG